MKKALWICLASVFGVLTVAGFVGNNILQGYRPQLNSFLHISTDSTERDANVNYFTTEFESVEKQMEEEGKLCTELEAEGAVLLKNEGNTLPFSSTRKFSLMVGVSRTHLLALESGESSPTFDMLERISAGLGVTPAQLVNFSVEFDHIKLM